MAEYAAQAGRDNGRFYGQATSQQRDAAFANIFGTVPPGSGRSQTMTSQSPQQLPPGRAQTMSTGMPDMMQRTPPVRHYVNGYGPPPEGIPYVVHQRFPPGVRPGPPPGPPGLRQVSSPYPPPPVGPPGGYPGAFGPRTSSQPPAFKPPIPARYPGGPPMPAMNSDQFRSQSMVTT